MRRVFVVSALALMVGGVAWSNETSPENTVKYRQAVMGGLGKHMRATSMIVKGEVNRPEDLHTHAVAMHDSAKLIPHLFPAGTGPDVVSDSEALPAVWSDQKKFEKAADAFIKETGKLAEIEVKGDDTTAFVAQFGKVGKTCGGCHDDFKKDDDH